MLSPLLDIGDKTEQNRQNHYTCRTYIPAGGEVVNIIIINVLEDGKCYRKKIKQIMERIRRKWVGGLVTTVFRVIRESLNLKGIIRVKT